MMNRLVGETRWFWLYEIGSTDLPGATSRRSKFETGDATMTLTDLRRAWPAWTPDERREFLWA